MKSIAVMEVDLERTPLGTRSRLAQELRGSPVLRRTVERLNGARRIDGVYAFAPADQVARCRKLLDGSAAIVLPRELPPPPWTTLVQSARKWSLDGWRGGIGGTTAFDEYGDCRLISIALRHAGADAALSLPPASPLIDPALTDRMVHQMKTAEDELDLVFTQAPPGLAGVLLRARLAHELAEKNVPLGWAFAYQPDNPRKDMLFLPFLCEVPSPVRYGSGRCVADTERAFSRLHQLLGTLENAADALTVSEQLHRLEAEDIEALPSEVEIELTTEDPYPDAILRPRGNRVPRRGPIAPALVARLVDELTAFDDTRVVLGGFGDPLRHPEFERILANCAAERPNGGRIHGFAVRTAGRDLGSEVIEALIANRVDVLNVVLDAWTPETYGRLQAPQAPSTASLPQIRESLEKLTGRSHDAGTPLPIIVPEMTKSKDNVDELDAFFDGWLRRLGAVSITGYATCGGTLPDHRVMSMAPPNREPCRRLRSRCLVLADGTVVACDQDLRVESCRIGHLAEQSLGEIWNGPRMDKLREAHRRLDFSAFPTCRACDEWHRP